MKNSHNLFIYFFTLVIGLHACVSKKRIVKSNKTIAIMSHMPTITGTTEVFDTTLFKNRPPIKILKDKGYVLECFRDNEYWKMYELKTIMIMDYQYLRGKNDPKILGTDYSVNPIFGVFKEFTKDGIIQVKGMICYYGFKLGTWYYYNALGRLTKSVDQDAGYKFGVADIINYCLKNSIPIEKKQEDKRNDFPLVTIARIRLKNKHPAWLIIYPENIVDKTVYIDAENGRILKIKITPAPLN